MTNPNGKLQQAPNETPQWEIPTENPNQTPQQKTPTGNPNGKSQRKTRPQREIPMAMRNPNAKLQQVT